VTQPDSAPVAEVIRSLDGVASAMTLCLACGFCCNGTLHIHTALLPEEAAPAAALGLRVTAVGNQPAFQQPCAKFQAGRCAIYDQRPQVCRGYACALLKRMQAGEITLEQALRVVGVVHKQLGVFQARVPDAPSFMHWLKAVEASADATGADAGLARTVSDDPAVSNHAVALVVYLTKYFGATDAEGS
jgi:hypothetical protein